MSRQDGEGVFKTRGKKFSMFGDASPPRIDAGSRGDTVVIADEEDNDEAGASKFGRSVTASGDLDIYDSGDVGVDATGGAVLAWGANPGLTGNIQAVSAFYTP